MTAAEPGPGQPYASIRRVLWITMGPKLVATVAKLAAGYLPGSLGLIAGGLERELRAHLPGIERFIIHTEPQPS